MSVTTDIATWKPLVIAPKFDAAILAGLLDNGGVSDVRCCLDNAALIVSLNTAQSNMIFLSLNTGPIEPLDWMRQFRRTRECALREAPVFAISPALTLTLAERCRQAGFNAIIGMPASTATLIATVKKVLTKPRPFIELDYYVGPCRRAGIVTAGTHTRRRRADASAA